MRIAHFASGAARKVLLLSEKKEGFLSFSLSRSLSETHHASKLAPPDREFNFEIVIPLDAA